LPWVLKRKFWLPSKEGCKHIPPHLATKRSELHCSVVPAVHCGERHNLKDFILLIFGAPKTLGEEGKGNLSIKGYLNSWI
jgi:hypothetical protein